ncbi:MAG: phospho-N-acetylmuramoyl-pentapeptide-transferase [Chloroflexi bacterium]|nr:MAG: phospho-N-acetylmuramoyl-pentapeptide-transferase [Chloroflexota bacterium]
MTSSVPLLALSGMLLTFVVTLVLFPPYMRLLRYLGIVKTPRSDAPTSHGRKRGTPTMAGLLVVLVVTLATVLFYFFVPGEEQTPGRTRGDYVVQTLTPLLALVSVGALGALDDYLDAIFGRGIRGRHKLIWQASVAVAGGIYIQRHFAITGIFIPLSGEWLIGGVAFIVLAIVAIVGTSNGVNLTDGLDGLSGGTVVFAFLSFAFIAFAREYFFLAVFCTLMTGAVAAFLWFNVHPAEVFLGDSGSLALGATLAVASLTTGFIALLPIAGVIFFIETLSVILQVVSFKVWHRRIFRMAPIHHHFELIGWPEEKVTIRFWLIGALAGIIAAILAFATPVK